VFVTAGSEAKCQACLELGAELAVNYRAADFVAAVRDATGGRGVDVILDMVGGDYLAQDVRALALEGRLVMIGFLGGTRAELNFAQVMTKRLTITGSTLRPQSVEAKARIAADLRREVWPLLEAGRIAPVMDRTYPLEAAAAAHARMESSAHIGKIVLTVV
jgi:NADPH2:quinone reductase